MIFFKLTFLPSELISNDPFKTISIYYIGISKSLFLFFLLLLLLALIVKVKIKRWEHR